MAACFVQNLDPVQGLVDYVLDIKPYHTKIIEVLVEYIYEEKVDVTITEAVDWVIGMFQTCHIECIYSILAVDKNLNTFTIRYDFNGLLGETNPLGISAPINLTSKFPIGQSFRTYGSRDNINDNEWTVQSTSFNPATGDFTITTDQDITDEDPPFGLLLLPCSDTSPEQCDGYGIAPFGSPPGIATCDIDSVNDQIVVAGDHVCDFLPGDQICLTLHSFDDDDIFGVLSGVIRYHSETYGGGSTLFTLPFNILTTSIGRTPIIVWVNGVKMVETDYYTIVFPNQVNVTGLIFPGDIIEFCAYEGIIVGQNGPLYHRENATFTAASQVFPLPFNLNPSVPATSQVAVYVNGIKLPASSITTTLPNFVTINDTVFIGDTIEFYGDSGECPAGSSSGGGPPLPGPPPPISFPDYIKKYFSWNAEDGIDVFPDYNKRYHSVTAVGGESVFNTPFTISTPGPGIKTLDVYINGIRQVEVDSYTITFPNTVTLTFVLTAGDLIEFYGYQDCSVLESGNDFPSYYREGTIVGVVAGPAGTGSFDVATDRTAVYVTGFVFTISGSTGNDGTYTVQAPGSTFGLVTTIPVVEAVPSAVADGFAVLVPTSIFTLPFTILSATPGENALQVFINGIKQTDIDAFTVTLPNTVTLTAPTQAGDTVEFFGVLIPNYSKTNYVSGPFVITVPFIIMAPFAGQATFEVFVNGVKQKEGLSYSITLPSTVTFGALNVNDKIEFYGYGNCTEPTFSSFLAPFTIPSPVSPSKTEFEVYVNGVKQKEGVSFTIALPSTINFLFVVPFGSQVELYVYEDCDTTQPGFVRPDYHTAIGNGFATAFIMPFTIASVAVTKSELTVYINGVKQTRGDSYTLTLPNTVNFVSPVPNGSVVEFYNIEVPQYHKEVSTGLSATHTLPFTIQIPSFTFQKNLEIFIDGVKQRETDAYTVVLPNTVIFSSIVPAGNVIEYYGYNNCNAVPPIFPDYNKRYHSVTAVGGETILGMPFTISTPSPTIRTLDVYINGIRQVEIDSYTITLPSTVTFTSPLDSGDLLEFYGYQDCSALQPGSDFPSYYREDTPVPTSIFTLPFTILSTVPGQNSLQVFINGDKQTDISSFSITLPNTVTLVTPTEADDTVEFFGVFTPNYSSTTYISGPFVVNSPFTIQVPFAGQATFEVFVNGVKQKEGPSYTITYPVTVTFSILDVNDEIEFYGYGNCVQPSGPVIVPNYSSQTFIGGIPTFIMPFIIEVAPPGEKTFEMYVNGIKQMEGVDYVIVYPSTIIFLSPLLIGDQLDFVGHSFNCIASASPTPTFVDYRCYTVCTVELDQANAVTACIFGFPRTIITTCEDIDYPVLPPTAYYAGLVSPGPLNIIDVIPYSPAPLVPPFPFPDESAFNDIGSNMFVVGPQPVDPACDPDDCPPSDGNYVCRFCQGYRFKVVGGQNEGIYTALYADFVGGQTRIRVIEDIPFTGPASGGQIKPYWFGYSEHREICCERETMCELVRVVMREKLRFSEIHLDLSEDIIAYNLENNDNCGYDVLPYDGIIPAVGEIAEIHRQTYLASTGPAVFTLSVPVPGSNPALLSVTIVGVPAAFILNTATQFTITSPVVNVNDLVVAVVKDIVNTQTSIPIVSASEVIIRPIISANSILDQFVVSGDFTARFVAGFRFEVVGNDPLNDGTHIVGSSSYAVIPDETTITVTTNVATTIPPSPTMLLGVILPKDEFVVAGNFTSTFVPGFRFNVVGNDPGNDGPTYTTSSSFAAGFTTIRVARDIETPTGAIGNIILPDYNAIVNPFGGCLKYNFFHKEVSLDLVPGHNAICLYGGNFIQRFTRDREIEGYNVGGPFPGLLGIWKPTNFNIIDVNSGASQLTVAGMLDWLFTPGAIFEVKYFDNNLEAFQVTTSVLSGGDTIITVSPTPFETIITGVSAPFYTKDLGVITGAVFYPDTYTTCVVPTTPLNPSIDNIAYIWLGPLQTHIHNAPQDDIMGEIVDGLGLSNRLVAQPDSYHILDVDAINDTFTIKRCDPILGIPVDLTDSFTPGTRFHNQETFNQINNYASVLPNTGPPGTPVQGTPPVGPGPTGYWYDTSSHVRVATTGNIVLSGLQTIDSKLLVASDRVLVKNQTLPAQNGVYIVSAGAWTRALDFDTIAEFVDAHVTVTESTTFARVATTSNIALSGFQTIDGVLLGLGDVVLVKNQTISSQNGVYVVTAGAWTRALDSNTIEELVDSHVTVTEGTTQVNTSWLASVNPAGTIGVSPILWSLTTSTYNWLASVNPAGTIGVSPILWNITTEVSAVLRQWNGSNWIEVFTFALDWTVLTATFNTFTGETTLEVVEDITDQTQVGVRNLCSISEPYFGRIIREPVIVTERRDNTASTTITENLMFEWTAAVDWFQYMVICADTATDTFTLLGNALSVIQPGENIDLISNNANNGTYTVSPNPLDGPFLDGNGNTLIKVTTNIPLGSGLPLCIGAGGFVEPAGGLGATLRFNDIIGVTITEDANATLLGGDGSLPGGWDVPFFDVGAFDESVGENIHLYGNQF